MTLQALKEAEFESSSLRLVPVAVQRIVSLKDLPILSYAFTGPGTEHPEKVFFDILPKRDNGRSETQNNFRVLAKHFTNGLFGLNLKLHGDRYAFWDGDIQYVAQTMQNMFQAKCRGTEDNKRPTSGAAIHGLGDVYVPLPQGATLFIGQLDEVRVHDAARWDIIVNGEINFFGEVRPFTIHHAHCQGFALPPLDVIMEEAMAKLFFWFPFLDGHVAVINRTYVTNPVTHQDRL